MDTDDQVIERDQQEEIQTMENPGLKRYTSPPPRLETPENLIKVTYRRTATTMVAPKTDTTESSRSGYPVSDFSDGISRDGEGYLHRDDIETPPPMAGGSSASPVGVDNGSEGADPWIGAHRKSGGTGTSATQVPGEVRQHANTDVVSSTNGLPPLDVNPKKPMTTNTPKSPVEGPALVQMDAANERRKSIQRQVGGGEKENPAYDRAQDQVQRKVQVRRAHPLHQGAFDHERNEWTYDLDDPDYFRGDPAPSMTTGHAGDMVRVKFDDPYETTPQFLESDDTVKPGRELFGGEMYRQNDASRDEALTRHAHHDPDQDIKDVLAVQGSPGNWNYDPYMHGMFNGMELVGAIHDRREPDFREAPEHWLEPEAEKAHAAWKEARKGETPGQVEPDDDLPVEPVLRTAASHPLHRLHRVATQSESDEEFWARQPDVVNMHGSTPDAAGEEYMDDEDHEADPHAHPDSWSDTDWDDLVPENMSLRDHSKLLRSGVMKWDGDARYPKYTHTLNREIRDSDGRRAFADEGHVIEHNTRHTGPVLPSEDNPDPHVLEYPWSHTYYPAGQHDDDGLTKGYNSVDQALHATNQLSLWGARHPESQSVLQGYRYVGHTHQPYNPAEELPHEAAMRENQPVVPPKVGAYDPDRQEFLYNIDTPGYHEKDKPPSARSHSAQPFMKLKDMPYQDHEPDEMPGEDARWEDLDWDEPWEHQSFPACAGCESRGRISQHPDHEIHKEPFQDYTADHEFEPVTDLAPGVRL